MEGSHLSHWLLPLTVTWSPGPTTRVLPALTHPGTPQNPVEKGSWQTTSFQGRWRMGSKQDLGQKSFPNLPRTRCLSFKHLLDKGARTPGSQSRGRQWPCSVIQQLTSSLLALWGHLFFVPMPCPPLLLHLGRPGPLSLRNQRAGLGVLAGQLGQGRGLGPGPHGCHTLTPPLLLSLSPANFSQTPSHPAPNAPANSQDQTALSWLTNRLNTEQQRKC